MNNFLYILGAGASANVLPIINSFEDEEGITHKSLIEELLSFTHYLNELEAYRIYYDLCQESLSFTTPDTFAKFLYVTGRQQDYIKFKTVLSAYFFWREHYSGTADICFDKRAVSFLATISTGKGHFPENVKIVTWNYDSQLIKAINMANAVKSENRFFPNYNSYPFKMDDTIDKVRLKVVHVNGVSGYTMNKKTKLIINKFDEKEKILQLSRVAIKENNRDVTTSLRADIKGILDAFSQENEELLVSFAWEASNDFQTENPYIHRLNETVRAIARATEILVVIGYSFPFFNREVDKLIFAEMPTLKKIYFKDPNLDGAFLYNQFNLDKNIVKIEHINNIRNYHVPYEL